MARDRSPQGNRLGALWRYGRASTAAVRRSPYRARVEQMRTLGRSEVLWWQGFASRRNGKMLTRYLAVTPPSSFKRLDARRFAGVVAFYNLGVNTFR
jgi:hypothetical protein